MAELLFELFSEEIPARMQSKAEVDLRQAFTEFFKKEGLEFSALQTFSTPRRLTLVVEGLPLAQADQIDERRGPRVDAPNKAIDGFLSSTGLARNDLEERDDPKGRFFYARIEKKGQNTAVLLKDGIPQILAAFPWPKSMKWGSNPQRWVRPLQSILCCFDGAVVPTEFAGLVASDKTFGHRFMAPSAITASTFSNYQKALLEAYVVIDAQARRLKIQEQAQVLAKNANLNLVNDEALLSEVAGLVEWPMVMMGSFDRAFLTIPSEALILEMKHHQKYFATTDKNGKLTNHFIFVANIDGDQKAITAGNERVLGARLADAQFFWDKDREKPLEKSLPALKEIVFHEKLGTMDEKVKRIARLAEVVATKIPDCDPKKARRAAELCKADLVSGMVGEFPELQGIMGGYYAKAQGEDDAVAKAISEHYSPLGPNDNCPSAPESIAIAIADKADNLVGFFAHDLLPTGSKDPFALRRAALGIIRLILENGTRLTLHDIFIEAGKIFDLATNDVQKVCDSLVSFIHDRLAVRLKEQNIRHDYVAACLKHAGAPDVDLVRIVSRVEALKKFLSTDDGINLLAGYKRASNIVGIEVKKGNSVGSSINKSLLELSEEKALFVEIEKAKEKVAPAIKNERFEEAMAAIAALRQPIDQFFEKVVVNVDATEVRDNRLSLLKQVEESLHQVADFSMIEN